MQIDCPKTEMVTRRPSDEIYGRDIRHEVEAEHRGEVVAIDVESGTWAIGDTVIVARDRLRTKRSDAIDVWLLRVGHRALRHVGGRPLIEGVVNAAHD